MSGSNIVPLLKPDASPPLTATLDARADALPPGDLAAIEALKADAVDSELPDAALDALAVRIGTSTGTDAAMHRTAMRTGRLAMNHAAGQAPPPLSSMPATMNAVQAMKQMNTRACFINDHKGTATYAIFGAGGKIQPRSREEMSAIFAPFVVQLPDGKGGTRDMPIFLWWSTNHLRNTFDRCLYDPENRFARAGERILNTWRGFAVTAKRGSWALIAWHLYKIVCRRDRAAWRYLLRWLAHAVQRPGTSPGVMIALRSDLEGTGKSTVGRLMCQIFGQHGHEANGHREIFGQFNEAVDDRTFVVLEEAIFPGDQRASEALKAVVTAATLSVNPKGKRAYTIPNVLHLLMTTNSRWAVPAGAAARRFLVLDVRDKPDQAYFDALYAEIENGGLEAFLDALLRMDLSGFNPRVVPSTAALVEQQRQSADDVYRWLADAVMNGELVPGHPNGGFNTRVASAVLHRTYVMWAQDQGNRHPKSVVVLARELRALGCTLARSAAANGWNVPDGATMMAAANRRYGIRT